MFRILFFRPLGVIRPKVSFYECLGYFLYRLNNDLLGGHYLACDVWSVPCVLWPVTCDLRFVPAAATMAAHSEEFASRGQKYQTCLILSSWPREANFSPKFPCTREETAEQTASRGSFLSSFLTVCGRLKEKYAWSQVRKTAAKLT